MNDRISNAVPGPEATSRSDQNLARHNDVSKADFSIGVSDQNDSCSLTPRVDIALCDHITDGTTVLDRIPIGSGADPQLLLRYANRHGLISGATGSGKTVTLQVLCEALSRSGVPVFLADVKGDLSGLAIATKKVSEIDGSSNGSIDVTDAALPVIFRDIAGRDGHRIGLKVSSMGPVLLGRLLDLSDAQSGALHVAFRIAQDAGHELSTLDDLILLLRWMGRHARDVSSFWGAVNSASLGAIQRRLLAAEDAGLGTLFGVEPPTIDELINLNTSGKGRITVLAADRLIRQPLVYAMLLAWFLEELSKNLPEVGDQARPCLAFFFDEAHLLFRNAPKELTSRIEQTVRLIRSKGVSVWFITQHPTDIPPAVLGQLGNRIMHGLRGFTARDRKALRGVAESMRAPADWNTQDRLANLATGEALVSFITDGGEPGITEQVMVRYPSTRIGSISNAERAACLVRTKPLFRHTYRPTRPLDLSNLDHLLDLERDAHGARDAHVRSQPQPGRPRQKIEGSGAQSRGQAAHDLGFRFGSWFARACIFALQRLRPHR